jgi:UDP-N-acetylmuramoylalanine--D-glutamate ligase
MIVVEAFKGKTVGVFGLGKSGLSTVRALVAGGATVYAADDKADSLQKAAALGAKAVPFAEWPWQECAALVLSPGVPLTHNPHSVVLKAREAGCPVMGDVDLLYLTCPQAQYIGITGTNGKSTTTALTAHVLQTAGLKVEVGGNLGTPVLDLAPLDADGVYVLELSSYQLDLAQHLHCKVAMLLNITPDHLDRHGDMTGYVTAKKRIFDRQVAGDVAVVSVDDEYCYGIHEYLRHFMPEVKRVPVTVGDEVAGGIGAEEGVIYAAINPSATAEYDLRGIHSLLGAHNWQNAAFVVAAATVLGCKSEAVFKGLSTFPGLAHRMERIATIGDVVFVNDSKATNADAAARALGAYADIYWIAGGKPKAGGIESLAEYFPRIVKAYLIGEAQEAFAAMLEGKVPYVLSGDLKTAFDQASEDALAAGHGAVLLSPACASFDQWPNFEVRGDAFRDYVTALVAKRRNAA